MAIGMGRAPKWATVSCTVCKGKGNVQQRSPFGEGPAGRLSHTLINGGPYTPQRSWHTLVALQMPNCGNRDAEPRRVLLLVPSAAARANPTPATPAFGIRAEARTFGAR
jgi:hypothetical protein